MPRLEQLNTIADWAGELNRLLDEADTASRKGKGLDG